VAAATAVTMSLGPKKQQITRAVLSVRPFRLVS
jgi:hypothetical protein